VTTPTQPATTPGAVRVRRAVDRDLPDVGEITAAAYVSDGFVSGNQEYLTQLRNAVARFTSAEVWVAVDVVTDEVLGSVTFCPIGSPYREIARTDEEAEFRMLSVRPSARRRGCARLLVSRCLDRARELGHTRMVLCSDERMLSAQRLYGELGFRRLPERDWSPVPGVSLWAFTLRL